MLSLKLASYVDILLDSSTSFIMSTPITDLVVVVCHGSYHTPAPYGPLLEALKARGIKAHCPQLPTADLTKFSVGDDSNPQGEEDTQVVLDVLICNQLTEVARPELRAKTRTAANGARGGKYRSYHRLYCLIQVG